jgi:hypothetical protein
LLLSEYGPGEFGAVDSRKIGFFHHSPEKRVKNQLNPLVNACPRLCLTITVINFKQLLTFSDLVKRVGTMRGRWGTG